jgi:uncharacterized protein (DUF1778 family)
MREKTRQISIRVPDVLLDYLEKQAQNEQKTRTQFIIQLLQKSASQPLEDESQSIPPIEQAKALASENSIAKLTGVIEHLTETISTLTETIQTSSEVGYNTPSNESQVNPTKKPTKRLATGVYWFEGQAGTIKEHLHTFCPGITDKDAQHFKDLINNQSRKAEKGEKRDKARVEALKQAIQTFHKQRDN